MPKRPSRANVPLTFHKKSKRMSKFQVHGHQLQSDLRRLLEAKDPRIHDFQIQAVFRTRQLLESSPENSDPALIVAPTGAGKSGMIVLLPYILQSEKLLVLTPSKVISDQLAVAFGQDTSRSRSSFLEICFGGGLSTEEKKQLKEVMEPVVVIKTSSQITDRDPGNLVIVNAQKFGGKSNGTLSAVYGTEESIADVKDFFGKFDTLIVDEAHHFPADTWKKIVQNFKTSTDGARKKIIFLTATPFRKVNGKDQLILPEQRVAFEVKRGELEGHMRKILRPVRFVEGKGYNGIADVEVLIRDIKTVFRRQGVEQPGIYNQGMILVKTIAQAEGLTRAINQSTLNRQFAIAIYNSATREDDINRFTRGRIRVAVICGSLNEGYDNPNVTLCILLKSVRSDIAFSQFVGRAIRMKKLKNEKDKTVATILSYPVYNQQFMWTKYEHLANNDPTDDDDE